MVLKEIFNVDEQPRLNTWDFDDSNGNIKHVEALVM